MKPEAPPWRLLHQPRPGPVSGADGPTPEPTRAPKRGHRGNAARYGPIDRAAESWPDRELTECLRRNPD